MHTYRVVDLSGDLDRIRQRAAEDPADAFGELMTLILRLNRSMQGAEGMALESILEKLREQIAKLCNTLREIAAGWGASAFDISVTLPIGISVCVTFSTQ